VQVRALTDRAYLSGTVAATKAERLFVRFEGGVEEWVEPGRVRVPPETRVRAGAPAKAAPPAAPAVRAVGDHVLICWHDLYWYPGVILAHDGEQYHVVFDDGNQGLVTADRLRPVTVAVGDRLWCRWRGGPEYYPGEITRKSGEVIDVQYDDGDEETTLLRLARLERDDWLPPGELGKLEEGDRVMGCWFDLNWYPGVIVSIRGKRLHVLFDDGDQATLIPARVKPMDLKRGDRVCCRRGGGPIYHPGEITRMSGERIRVRYDDGEEENTSIRLVRVEREGYRDDPGGAFD
jgi:hypothetical protein